jgi:lipoyl-dependent peroxiredoxin
MPTRTGSARWHGGIKEGSGTVHVDGVLDAAYSAPSRFEEAEGTNPEELIGAAHAGCFTMFLASVLSREGFEPTRIDTDAHVTIERLEDQGPTITTVRLETEAEVPEVDEETFRAAVDEAEHNCPVSKALSGGPEISVDAHLAG